MKINIKKFTIEDKELFEKAKVIRTKVFIEEQNVSEELEYEYDEICTHFILIYKKKAVATARYRETEEGYKLERFAVLKEYRGKEFGAIILRHMLNDLDKSKKIYLNAQVQVIGFYEKLGFKTEGDSFYEANIEHKKMIYSKNNPKDLAREKGYACKNRF